MDLVASTALVVLALGAVAAWLLRPRVTFARVDTDGGSPLLGKGVMNGLYAVLDPVGDGCAQRGVTANALTLTSLVLALLAGAFVAFGHFGVAAFAIVLASLGDAMDGIVARKSHTASARGENFDAAVDRYSEFSFLAGLAVHYRISVGALVLTLAALLASVMVSYASAKAEALGVHVPRGSMRRPERAVLLGVGAALVPFAAALAPAASGATSGLAGESPMLAALALVAFVGNASAVRRFIAIDHALSSTEATPSTRPSTTREARAALSDRPRSKDQGAQ